MNELRSRDIDVGDTQFVPDPKSGTFKIEKSRRPFLNRTAPALAPGGIDPKMAREMLDYAETNQFSFAPNISSPLQQLADGVYGTSTGRNRERIQVDPRLQQAQEKRKQAQEAMNQGSRGSKPTEESNRLNAEAQALEDEARNDAYANRGGGANPRNLEDLTVNNEGATDTTDTTPTTDNTETEQSVTATITDEDQTPEQNYRTFAERRMQRDLDNLGLGNSDEARALALRLDAAGISSLRFGAFIKENNRDRLALGKAAHSDLDSYVGDFLLTQAEKEISGKSSRYGMRRNYLPSGQYNRQTGERFIETFTKGGQEVEALRGLRKLVENGSLSYSDLDQTLFAKGGGISSERRGRIATASGGPKNRIPLDLDAYDALLKKRQTEAENFAREAANEGNIYTANLMRLRAEAFGLNDVEALNRFNQLLAMNPVTGKSDAQTIQDYLRMMDQAERLAGEPAQKIADEAKELLEFAEINEDTVNFYNAVMEFRTK
jgi:hypothetical protein